MAGLSQINVNRAVGGLGRRALSKDGVAGLVLYNDSPPTGFSSTPIIKIFSIAEAETLGIIEGGTFAADWYHIDEFFRAKVDGELWVGYFAEPAGAYDFLEVATISLTSNGEIRLMGVYAPLETYAASQVTALQAAVDTLPQDAPVSAFLGSDMSSIVAVTGWGSVADLRTGTSDKVTVVAGQDGGGAGKALFDAGSVSITVLGRMLGDVATAAVNQSVGEVGIFQISDGTELEIPALANGDLVSDLTTTALGSVKDKGYAVIRKRLPNVSGTFHERTPTAIAFTSDFAFIENVRVIDKATRLLIAVYTPYLNSRVSFNPDGTLTDDVLGFFTSLGESELDASLVSTREASGAEILIDDSQDVQSTSTLVITAKIQPTAIAEFITVNIGLTVELSN